MASNAAGNKSKSFKSNKSENPPSTGPRKLEPKTKPVLKWDTAVQYVKGVGPNLGSLLSKRGIRSVGDLISYYPRAYEDRRAARSIASLKAGDVVSFVAQIAKISAVPLGRQTSSRKIYDFAVRDSSGLIHCKFFRVPYRGYFDRFHIGDPVRITGKVILYRNTLEFHHPELQELTNRDSNGQLAPSDAEKEETDELIPIYTEIETITSSRLRRLIDSVFKEIENQIIEAIPAPVMSRLGLISRREALTRIHFPEASQAEQYNDNKSAAHRRLIFEEFFWLELFLASRQVGLKKDFVQALSIDNEIKDQFLKALPFSLTKAQLRAIDEIEADLRTPHPMHRLVQGDVGSGKTLVAFIAALGISKGGAQACLMVPTEILAEQHFKSAQRLLAPHGMRSALLSSRTRNSERLTILQDLKDGKIRLLIGTHALIEDDVDYKNLRLVIIDEQHRFGVEQKLRLKSKGHSPHFLVMTATPIPRTLAMTVYGDLDVSLIDEMPLDRKAIKTRVVGESKRDQVLKFVEDQLVKGHQAYFVYPLVEESEKIDLKNAVSEFERIKIRFPKYNVGLLHGKMTGDEKDKIMTQFRANELQVLVSTTVIEVGVDVPNANIIVIEHAERFGLSQLHQLRGRVGRGAIASFCIMMLGYAVSEEARTRVSFMEQTNDGFKVAEFDLELRGPGEFLGTRQSGLQGFQLASIVRDASILQEARTEAFRILREDPNLERAENAILREELLKTHGPAQLGGVF